MSWLNMLQTAQMSVWACDTGLNIILAVLDFFPDEPVFSRDPVWGLKGIFRKKEQKPI
jgi:hypothetical protein